jgi:hypothetical protein
LTRRKDQASERRKPKASGILRFGALVCAAWAVFALVISIIMLLGAWSSSVPAPAGYRPARPLRRSLPAGALPVPCSLGVTLLAVNLHQVDIASGALVANLSLCMGSKVAKQLARDSPKTNPGVPMLTVQGFESTFSTRLVPIAKAQVLSGGVAQPIGSVTLPLDSNPRAYPRDRYETQITAQTLGTCVDGVGDPLMIGVVVDPGVGNFNWSSQTPPFPLGPPVFGVRPQILAPPLGLTLLSSGLTFLGPGTRTNYGGNAAEPCVGAAIPVVVQAARPTTTRLFVLSLALIPLLLIALLILRWLSEGSARSTDGLVGVAAIMLAILPIRLVLVPSEITSLTLVDFILGAEMALLAAVTVILWLVWPAIRRPPASRSRREQRRETPPTE